MTTDTPTQADLFHQLRRREVQAIGAAISTRNWHDLECAYNALRDKMDAAGAWNAPASQPEAGAGADRDDAEEYPTAWTISKRRYEEKQKSYGTKLPPMADKPLVEQIIDEADALTTPTRIQAAGDGEKMKVLLPPASVDQEFLDGWISGQQYLILNYGSKEEFDEAVTTPTRIEAAQAGEAETAWLIERHDLATVESRNRVCLHYYAEWPNGIHWWTPDHMKAKRFACEAAANAASNNDPLLRVVEHMWINATPTRIEAAHPQEAAGDGEKLRAAMEKMKLVSSWLCNVAACDMDEIVADGGVTAAMVVRKEAEFQQERARSAIADIIEALATPPQPPADLVERDSTEDAISAFMDKIVVDGNGGLEFLEDALLAACDALSRPTLPDREKMSIAVAKAVHPHLSNGENVYEVSNQVADAILALFEGEG